MMSPSELCKALNRRCFSNITARTKEAFSHLQAVQHSVLTSPTSELFAEEEAARSAWLFFSAAEESFFKQKSRVRWLSEGDANTRVFHKSVKANLCRNVIHYLQTEEDSKIYDPCILKDMVVQFYSDLLGVENGSVTPMTVDQIQQLHPFRCEASASVKLSAIPTDEEIRSTLFSLPKNKAPGPDGFSVEFFTSAWDLVGKDVISAVKSFFTTSVLPRQVNATVISLIPKVSGADKLSDFRPISLCNTVYKVISKIIASRLQDLTPDIVQRNQVGFVKGRILSENVLLASELVSDFNKEGTVTRGCLQIDITKAYDNVDWRFLFNVLEALELPQNLRNWVRVCVSSPHYSIALNGELAGFFPGKKGLRQGDLISSSLFVIVMDLLSKQLDRAALAH